MTSSDATAAAERDGVALPGRRNTRWTLLFGTPILLGASFLVHPDGSGGLEGLLRHGNAWLYLHFALLPLLGLLGASFYVLLADYSGRVATIGRFGVAVYTTFYAAFEAIAGIATGLLTHEAHTLSAAQQAGLAAGIDALVAPSLALGLIGSLGALVAVGSVGVLLRRSGAPLLPILLLGGAPLATIFHGGTPLDALGMAAFLVGVAWLEVGWRRPDERASAQATQEPAR